MRTRTPTSNILYAALLACAAPLAWAVPPGAATPCAITSSAPSYNDNIVNNLSCDTSGNLRVNATVSGGTTTPALGITPTDHTLTSATGSSQTVMSANAARHSMTISNTGNANCGVNPSGGTAVIGGAGTLTIVPSGSYTPRVPSLSAVKVICTAGQPLYADEN